MPTSLRPSQRLTALIHEHAWNDTTVLDLLGDFLNAHPTEAEVVLAYVAARAAHEDAYADSDEGGEEPEPAAAGESVVDLDERFGILRAASGDLFEFDEVKDHPMNFVWTITSGTDDGSQWASAGFHVVNRLGYIRTDRPWSTGDERFSVR